MRRLWPVFIIALFFIALIPQAEGATLPLKVDATLLPPTCEPGSQIVVMGDVCYLKAEEEIPVEGAAVNVTIVKSNPIYYVTDVTDSTGHYDVQIQAPSVPGAYTINVTAIDGSSIAYREAKLVVREPSPDLYLTGESIEFSSPSPKTGEVIDIEVTVFNAGKAVGTGDISVYDGDYPLGKLLGTETVEVEPGEGSTVAVTASFGSGAHTICALVTNVTPEDKDVGNQASNRTLNVQDVSPPSIISVSRDPLSPTSTQAVNVTATVTDDMALDPLSPVELNVWVDGALETIQMELTEGSNYTAAIQATPHGTTVEYSVSATDTSGNKNESDRYSYTPDFSFLTVELARSHIFCNVQEEIAIEGWAYLDGTVPAPNSTVDVTLHYLQGQETWTGSTDKNGSFSVVITTPGDEGTYDAGVSATNMAFAAEAVEVLLWVEKTVPDFVVDGGDIAFNSLGNTGLHELHATVQNAGELRGKGTVSFYDGAPSPDTLLGTVDVDVKPGSRKVYSIAWNATPGVHSIYVIVESSTIDDNELDNEAVASITIPSPEEGQLTTEVEGLSDEALGIIFMLLLTTLLMAAVAVATYVRMSRRLRAATAQRDAAPATEAIVLEEGGSK